MELTQKPGAVQAVAVAMEAVEEMLRASAKFPPFNSGHEGYAVLLEEVEELKDEIFWGPTKGGIITIDLRDEPFPPMEEEAKEDRQARRVKLMREEAIQVAAMAMRFVIDVCDREATSNTGETNA